MINEAPVINTEPIYAMYPSNITKNIIDSRNTSSKEGGLSLIDPDALSCLEVGKRSKVAGKRKTLSILHAKVKGLGSEGKRLRASKIQLLQEVDSLRHDRAAVVARVILDTTLKLIHSDEVGVLTARLVKASIIHGRCAAFEEVAELKKPFVLKLMPSSRPSSNEEYDRAGIDLADASYPFLAELTDDLHAFVQELLSKKS
nr:hypothetical protein [Tanacetum cinerariifolium]